MWQGAGTLQFDTQRHLRHFLSFDAFQRQDILKLFSQAEQLLHDQPPQPTLAGLTVGLLFFEPSTRTRASFELAAKRLGAHTLNLAIQYSSTTKGETFYDTLANLNAMGLDALVLRHPHSGAALFAANHFHQHTCVINAGDGCHAHPTQALLDIFTLVQQDFPLEKARIAIVGDIQHSRVARSQIALLKLLGVPDLRLVGPTHLVPTAFSEPGISIHHDLKTGLDGVDAIFLLRLQQERMGTGSLLDLKNYHQQFGLNKKTLSYASPSAFILHPGPINREVEITSELADSKQALILTQVRYGLAIRMAILETLLALKKRRSHASPY